MGVNDHGWPNRLHTVDNKARKGKRDQATITFSSQGIIRKLVVYPVQAPAAADSRYLGQSQISGSTIERPKREKRVVSFLGHDPLVVLIYWSAHARPQRTLHLARYQAPRRCHDGALFGSCTMPLHEEPLVATLLEHRSEKDRE
jgi:hypothetical protein